MTRSKSLGRREAEGKRQGRNADRKASPNGTIPSPHCVKEGTEGTLTKTWCLQDRALGSCFLGLPWGHHLLLLLSSPPPSHQLLLPSPLRGFVCQRSHRPPCPLAAAEMTEWVWAPHDELACRQRRRHGAVNLRAPLRGDARGSP